MAIRVYANEAQLIAYGAPPGVTLPTGAEAVRQLTRASELVDEALIAAVYATDSVTQLPTDPNIIEALRNATCAQVVHWADPEAETGETGTPKGYSNVSIGSVSLGRGSSSSGSSAGSSMASGRSLAPQAITHLRLAVDARGLSLLPGTVHTTGVLYW